jgi:hypothetical protein
MSTPAENPPSDRALNAYHFAGTRGCRVHTPVFALVDPWWTRREALRMDAVRRTLAATSLKAAAKQRYRQWLWAVHGEAQAPGA